MAFAFFCSASLLQFDFYAIGSEHYHKVDFFFSVFISAPLNGGAHVSLALITRHLLDISRPEQSKKKSRAQSLILKSFEILNAFTSFNTTCHMPLYAEYQFQKNILVGLKTLPLLFDSFLPTRLILGLRDSGSAETTVFASLE